MLNPPQVGESGRQPSADSILIQTDKSLPFCIHTPTLSKGSAICSLLIPQQATYHLHPRDPVCLLHPPCSSPSLLPPTPSFLSPIHLVLFMFYTQQLKRFVDISFSCVLEYGFIHTYTHGQTFSNLLLTATLGNNPPPPCAVSLWQGSVDKSGPPGQWQMRSRASGLGRR